MLYNEPRRRVTQQTWVFNNTMKPPPSVSSSEFVIRFMCNDVQYQEISVEYALFYMTMHYIPASGNTVTAFRQNKWTQDYYRTITLLEEPSADLLTFLQKYATLQS